MLIRESHLDLLSAVSRPFLDRGMQLTIFNNYAPKSASPDALAINRKSLAIFDDAITN